jgi:hypothetical protein
MKKRNEVGKLTCVGLSGARGTIVRSKFGRCASQAFFPRCPALSSFGLCECANGGRLVVIVMRVLGWAGERRSEVCDGWWRSENEV